MRIAIIEDDEITRLELSKLLNTQGYETVLLIDFGNLTDELKQYSIELVLLDINLPYENGYEVCRKIKQVMPVPIIFVTSRDTNADELKSIQVGGIDFITKPYDTLILLEKIKRALQLSNPNNFRELVKKDCAGKDGWADGVHFSHMDRRTMAGRLHGEPIETRRDKARTTKHQNNTSQG